MKVILPVAGRGERLRPVTDSVPKALVEVDGVPLLGHALAPVMALPAGAVEEIILVVGHLGDAIEPWYRQRYRLPLHVAHQAELNGQAGAIAQVADRLTGPLLILFCDTLHDADIGALARLGHSPDAPDGVLHVKPVDDPRRFGVAVLDWEGYVKQLVEKPRNPISDLGVVGVYWIKDGARLARAITALIERDGPTHGEHYGEHYLADALQLMIDDGARFEARRVSRWLDCGTLQDLQNCERELIAEREASARSVL